MTTKINLLIIAIAAVLGACYSSNRLTGDGSSADDTSGSDAAEMMPDTLEDVMDAVDAVEDQAQPDLTPPQCASDSDCVVALHEDRCCHTCPYIISRAEMEDDVCLHELGTGFQFPMPEPPCAYDCYACVPCSDPPVYSAKCVGGRCVGVQDACDFPETTPAIPSLQGSDFFDTDNYASYVGQFISVEGNFYRGPDSCACCFDCDCDCFETPVQPTIDCGIIMRGKICDDEFGCRGTECEGSCAPIDGWGLVGAGGFLVPNELNTPELWVVEWSMYY